MGASAYVLQIWLSGGAVDEYPVLKGELTLGRGRDNDIILDDPRVSGRHTKLTISAETPMIMDLGSTNGTQLNGRPISVGVFNPFSPGDVITVGSFSISVREVSPQSPAPPPVADKVKISSRPQPGLAVYVGQKLNKYLLDKPQVTLGRASDNAVVIPHAQVSGHHAQVQRVQGGFQVTDLGSTNGLTHNGQRIQSKQLADGDVVYLSDEVLLQFRSHVGFVPVAPSEPAVIASPPTKSLDLRGQETITIGRAQENDIVLDHPQVSRHHAILERLGGRYRLRDLKSSNGVFVNNQRIEKEFWPKEGDQINIGPFRLSFAEDGIEPLPQRGLRLDVFDLQKWVRKDLNLLKNISLSIYPQEFVALVGLSGAGKSTLMDAINGFRPATNGAVLVNGDNLYENFDMYRNDMGYVPQQDIVHRELTVYTALDYAGKLRMPADTTPQERHKRVMEVMEELDLSERKDLPIHKLSGGQLKRVSIGVELLTKPRLFFLDEPTSGLDPGTEYNMMTLLRHLADQGRTIMLITHATKNVMMCDKVIILVRGGRLAYYGPPEEALTYFNQYRTEHERRVKNIEFDDIYMILEDDERGSSEDWAERYRQSKQYQENVVNRLRSVAEPQKPAAVTTTRSTRFIGAATKRVSALRQFFILSARNLKIMLQDRASLLLLLALPPFMSLLEFSTLDFSPETGDVGEIITTMFLSALIAFMIGALTSVREIVKEIDIYKRERAISLKIAPYVLSKVWIGVVLSLYTAVMFLLVRQGMMSGLWPDTTIGADTLGVSNWLAMFVTVFLNTLAGYLTGLAISAVAPNPNVAILLVIVALVPQFLFAGGMMPLDLLGDGGKFVSNGVTTRWAFEASLNILGFGDPLVEDPCWGERPKYEEDGEMGWNDYLNASPEKKEADCDCMGAEIFTGPCRYFPGVKSEDFYTDQTAVDLNRSEPAEPATQTPWPTFTPLPTLTPYPTLTPPASRCETEGTMNCGDFQSYMDQIAEQSDEYQDMREEQGDDYEDQMQEQGEDYEDVREDQGETYRDAMNEYAEDRSDWERNREQAVGGAEGLLSSIYENQGQAFRGSYTKSWGAMSIILGVLLLGIMGLQRWKDSLK